MLCVCVCAHLVVAAQERTHIFLQGRLASKYSIIINCVACKTARGPRVSLNRLCVLCCYVVDEYIIIVFIMWCLLDTRCGLNGVFEYKYVTTSSICANMTQVFREKHTSTQHQKCCSVIIQIKHPVCCQHVDENLYSEYMNSRGLISSSQCRFISSIVASTHKPSI